MAMICHLMALSHSRNDFVNRTTFKAKSSSDWLVVEIYNNRIHKIFMATDNTSDISENDIIVAFELKNNSNPLAIYLEYQSKFFSPNGKGITDSTDVKGKSTRKT